jgi:hypothetical protein
MLTDWPAGGCDPGPRDLILAGKDREVNFRVPAGIWTIDLIRSDKKEKGVCDDR